jgi:hypothetical protein
VDSATHDVVAHCGAGGQPKLELHRKHTRMWCCCYARRGHKPVDISLLLSPTKYNWSLAPVEADVDSATHDVEAQCGAGGQPKLDI